MQLGAVHDHFDAHRLRPIGAEEIPDVLDEFPVLLFHVLLHPGDDLLNGMDMLHVGKAFGQPAPVDLIAKVQRHGQDVFL